MVGSSMPVHTHPTQMEVMIKSKAQELAEGNSDAAQEVLAQVLQAMEECGSGED